MAEPITTTDASAADLVVDIVSDVVCPWCYIGKRKLETALTELKEPPITTPVRATATADTWPFGAGLQRVTRPVRTSTAATNAASSSSVSDPRT